MRFDLRHGDSREVLRSLDAASVDALVTDPPAGISFMNRSWDHDHGGRAGWVAAFADIFRECLRILKPGAHGLVWALPRTSHWTATALEDAGFEIRDVGVHLFGSGFPKSLDVSKALDKAAGAEREVVGPATRHGGGRSFADGSANFDKQPFAPLTAPATDLARQWSGWGTALKPAAEHWILVRKPLDGTVAANVAAHGTGALNIDACRIGFADGDGEWNSTPGRGANGVAKGTNGIYGHYGANAEPKDGIRYDSSGRWPANVTLDEEAAALLDAQSGDVGAYAPPGGASETIANVYSGGPGTRSTVYHGDVGGASRFMYVAKPDRGERDIGCEDLPAVSGGAATDRKDGSAGTQNPRAGAGRNGGARNIHPTVKSVDLMRWLCRLVTPKGGLVLDPFMGSGSTGIACAREGMRFIGIERERAYFEIARRRIVGDAPLLNRIGQLQLEGPEKDDAA